MTQVTRSADCANSPKNARAEDIALAIMGVGRLDPALLAENAVWERPGGALTGPDAISTALAGIAPSQQIAVTQVMTHGKSGSVLGTRMDQDGAKHLFCHVIKFSSAAAKQVAQIVSFEHRGKG